LMYVGCALLPFAVTVALIVDRRDAVTLLAAPLAYVRSSRCCGARPVGPDAVLGATGRLQLGYGVLLAIGLAL